MAPRTCLLSVILFSFIVTKVHAESSLEKTQIAFSTLEKKLNRSLNTEEKEQIGNWILNESNKNKSPLLLASTAKEASLNMVCIKGGISPGISNVQALTCIADDWSSYSIILIQLDSVGIEYTFSVAYVRMTGPAAYELTTNTKPTDEKAALPFYGVSSSVHWIGGGDLTYLEDCRNSSLTIAALGVGFGLNL